MRRKKLHSGIPAGTKATLGEKSVDAREGESVWSLLKRLNP
jgi:hypothetical protein